MGDPSRTIEELLTCGRKNIVQLLDIVLHVHWVVPHGLDFSEVKVPGNQIVQNFQLIFR